MNAGMLDLAVESACEEVSFYAEEEEIKGCLEYVHDKSRIHCKSIDFDERLRFEDTRNIDVYKRMIEEIVIENRHESNYIILSSNIGIIYAIKKIAKQYKGKKFGIVFHANLEAALDKAGKKQAMVHLIRKTKLLSFAFPIETCLKNAINDCRENAIYFITYSPTAENLLKSVIDFDILKKFVFLHHPMIDKRTSERRTDSKQLFKVGIYGQAVNQNAYSIINEYNARYDNGKVRFCVKTTKNSDIYSCKNVVSMFQKDFVSNIELEEQINNLDYIIIPYDYSQYRLTASGILCDAVSEETPVLMLNSPYLEFYSQYGIGIISNTPKDLAKEIAKISEENRRLFSDKEKELKRIIKQENISTFKELIMKTNIN